MVNRPPSRGYNPRNSVLWTQEKLHEAERKLREHREAAAELEGIVETLKQKHREQIARSLTSPWPEEKQMAEGIATWWEVPLPEQSTSLKRR